MKTSSIPSRCSVQKGLHLKGEYPSSFLSAASHPQKIQNILSCFKRERVARQLPFGLVAFFKNRYLVAGKEFPFY